MFATNSMKNTSRMVRSFRRGLSSGGFKIDMTGKTVFVGGVADSTGYGWAIAKSCAEAGAKVILGTWPPMLQNFKLGLEKGAFAEDQKLSDGSKFEITKVILKA